ncbi:DUF3307 domain-containing protein [Jannaschia sp. CCS1]|uniref:DUF3307 domain-containing protein n=1 Tax=Jannaschia sp. (strain CCS1) TaxID=290400 RepID=UPI000053C86D|nr:DUF3307 domain-containing protein [Jannaschia sp. CCS1]ABD55441.1 hypothetical protein Jann_2524 [Jannaschia sp. CCS1]
MAAYTFAALFLAHVIADYVLQTTWMVVNKKRPIAMAAHIGLVLGTMCATTLTLNPWFLALAALHLWIDIIKTYAMPEGLGAYVADQVLHVASIAGIALLAPQIWPMSPLADVDNLPLYYMIIGGVLFAARGGQYAVAMLVSARGTGSGHGVVLGWAERAALCVVLIGGWQIWPLLLVAVIAVKGLYMGVSFARRDTGGRARLLLGSGISLAWGLAVAVPLALVMPMMQ